MMGCENGNATTLFRIQRKLEPFLTLSVVRNLITPCIVLAVVLDLSTPRESEPKSGLSQAQATESLMLGLCRS